MVEGAPSSAVSVMSQMRGVTHLGIHKSEIGAAEFRSVAKMKTITDLTVDHVPVDERVFRELASLDKLSYLSISETKVQSLRGIHTLPALEVLEVKTSPLQDDITDIAQCMQLRQLMLSNVNCTDLALESIAQVKSLRTLVLANMSLTERSLTSLLKMDELVYLQVVNTGIPERSGVALKKRLTKALVLVD